MKKCFFILGVSLLCCSSIYAQHTIDELRTQYDATNYLEAKSMADIMVGTTDFATNGEVWKYKGMAEYGLYKKPTETNDSLLFDAVESFKAAYQYSDDAGHADILKQMMYVRSSLELKGNFYFGGQQFDKAYQFFSKAMDDQDFMKQNWADASFIFDTSIVADAATVSFLAGKKEQAVMYYEMLVKMNYNHPEIYNDLANIYQEEGKNAEAEALLENAVIRFPDDPAILNSLIDIYTLQKAFDKASSLADLLAVADKNNAQSLFKAGEVYGALASTQPAYPSTSFDKAEAFFKKSLAIDGANFDTQHELGYLYYKRAMAISEELDKVGDVASSKKQMTERDGMFQKAITSFEKANITKPNDVNVLKMLKALYMLTLQYDKAQVVANKLYQMGVDR